MTDWVGFGYMSLAVFIAVILTEIVKYPIKKKLGTSTGYGWLYILLSLVLATGVYALYWYIANDKTFPIGETTLRNYVSFMALEQAMFNLIWEKGLKVVVQGIVSKITGVNKTVVGTVMEVTGVNDKLDEIKIKDDTGGADLGEMAKSGTSLWEKIKGLFGKKKEAEEGTTKTKTLAKPVSIHDKK